MLTAKQVFERFSPETDSAEAMLDSIVRESHLLIRLVAISAEQEPHSTIAAYVIMPNGTCAWIHAGDSRIYHFREGKLLFQTSDHSYVQTLVDKGELTLEEARCQPTPSCKPNGKCCANTRLRGPARPIRRSLSPLMRWCAAGRRCW